MKRRATFIARRQTAMAKRKAAGWPEKLRHATGLRVRLRHDQRCGPVTLKAGTEGNIAPSPSWSTINFTGDECECCGLQPVMARMHWSYFEIVPAQGMVPREDSRSEAEGVAHQPGPASQDAPTLHRNPDTSDRLGEG